jgi:hypothetical protein
MSLVRSHFLWSCDESKLGGRDDPIETIRAHEIGSRPASCAARRSVAISLLQYGMSFQAMK